MLIINLKITNMKTPKDITDLNFNDLAFFRGLTTTEAKLEIAIKIFSPDELEKNLTKSGTPKVKIKDRVLKSDFEIKIKSNSNLDGKCHIDYLIKTYNKGVPLNTLREFSQNKAFSKAIKFTGKYQILNSILNKDQYRKVQKTWLRSHVLRNGNLDLKGKNFVKSNPWAEEFLKEELIP